jgi:hypothetical protein
MLDTDDLALWYAINRLITNYWADVETTAVPTRMSSTCRRPSIPSALTACSLCRRPRQFALASASRSRVNPRALGENSLNRLQLIWKRLAFDLVAGTPRHRAALSRCRNHQRRFR